MSPTIHPVSAMASVTGPSPISGSFYGVPIPSRVTGSAPAPLSARGSPPAPTPWFASGSAAVLSSAHQPVAPSPSMDTSPATSDHLKVFAPARQPVASATSPTLSPSHSVLDTSSSPGEHSSPTNIGESRADYKVPSLLSKMHADTQCCIIGVPSV